MNDLSTENIPIIKFGRRGIKGQLVEHFAYGDTFKQIASFWGFNTYNELISAQEITLPEEARTIVSTQLTETISDGRERACTFGWDHSVQVINQQIGNDSFYDFLDTGYVTSMQAEVGPTSHLLFLKETFFNKSSPIWFHNHPWIGGKKLKNISVKLDKDSDPVVWNISAFQAWQEFIMDSFSGQDLTLPILFRRSRGSLLLGTRNTLIYIAPKYAELPYEPQLDTTANRYQKKLHKLFEIAGLFLLASTNPEGVNGIAKHIRNPKIAQLITHTMEEVKSIEDLKRQRDQLLIDYCDSMEYIPFKSSDSYFTLHPMR